MAMPIHSNTSPLAFLQDLRFDAAKSGARTLDLDVLDAAIEIVERDESTEMQDKIDDLEDQVQALKGEIAELHEELNHEDVHAR